MDKSEAKIVGEYSNSEAIPPQKQAPSCVCNVKYTMYTIQCIVYNVYYTCNLSRPKEAASNLPKFKPFWKLDAILEAGSNFSTCWWSDDSKEGI